MIKKIKVVKEKDSKKILKDLRPYVAYWLEENFKKLTLPQQYAIPLIKSGKNVLITAPTGSGKTLAAFTSIIDELFSLAEEGKLEDKVYCIYIFPHLFYSFYRLYSSYQNSFNFLSSWVTTFSSQLLCTL